MPEYHMRGTPVEIPAFPPHIRYVPRGPQAPNDLNRPEIIAEWLRWGQDVYNHRMWTWAAGDGFIDGINVEEFRAIERIRCEDPLYAITMYMSVFETDPAIAAMYPWYNEENYGWLPAIPFEFQCRMIRWMQARSAGEGGIRVGWIGKPRRMGATDYMVNYALANWLFQRPYSCKFVSRKKELVYDKGNMDAMIQRVTSKLDLAPDKAPIPTWLLPPGWTDDYVVEMKVTRPDNNNIIHGESTTSKSGRGGRGRDGFIDEGAAIGPDLPQMIGATLATVRTCFVASSETVEYGEDFVEMKRNAESKQPASVFNIEYWEHPFQDEDWLEREEQKYIEAGVHDAFFREILRKAEAGFDGWMYMDAQDKEVLTENIDPLHHPQGSIDVCIDPGYSDETAIHWVLMDWGGPDTVLEAYVHKGMPAEYHAAIIAGCNPDDFPEYYFPPQTQMLMQQVAYWRDHGMPIRRVCGDPYGTNSLAGPNRHGQDDSWYARMVRFWEENNPEKDEWGRGKTIPVLTNWSIKDGRSIQARRLAMMHWLRSGLQFNDTPNVRLSLDALKRTRWQPESERRITELKDAYHDKYSHRRSSLEYMAVNREEFLWTAGQRPVSKRVESFSKRLPGVL